MRGGIDSRRRRILAGAFGTALLPCFCFAQCRRVAAKTRSIYLYWAAFPGGGQCVADRFNFFTIASNTNLVKANEVPDTYEDLLHPRFAGRVGIEASDVDWFGAMVKAMGEEKGLAFFRKLAAAKPEIRSGHTLMAALVASGEIPLAATLYNHNAERLVVKGAPIRWKALKPTFGRPNAIGVARRAPHPYAALLFSDF